MQKVSLVVAPPTSKSERIKKLWSLQSATILGAVGSATLGVYQIAHGQSMGATSLMMAGVGTIISLQHNQKLEQYRRTIAQLCTRYSSSAIIRQFEKCKVGIVLNEPLHGEKCTPKHGVLVDGTAYSIDRFPLEVLAKAPPCQTRSDCKFKTHWVSAAALLNTAAYPIALGIGGLAKPQNICNIPVPLAVGIAAAGAISLAASLGIITKMSRYRHALARVVRQIPSPAIVAGITTNGISVTSFLPENKFCDSQDRTITIDGCPYSAQELR